MVEIVVIVVAYLLGSIPSGVWVGQLFFQTDIREHGSGNSGTTNTYRVLGKNAGTIVLILDIAKGTVAALLPVWLGLAIHPMIVGIFAVIGHVFPIFARFKGGKAVATSAGIAIGAQPLLAGVLLLIWIAVLLWSSMVSLASIVTVLVAAAASLFIGDTIFAVVAWIAMIIVIVRHRSNIERIRNGEESRVPFGRRSSKKD